MGKSDGFFQLLQKLWYLWAAIVGIIAIISVVSVASSYYSCHARWAGSARAVNFDPISGCRVAVEAKDGDKMVPENNVSIIEQPKALEAK